MDDAGCFWALLTIGVDVRHDVMPDDSFSFFRDIVVDVIDVGFELGDLLVGDV